MQGFFSTLCSVWSEATFLTVIARSRVCEHRSPTHRLFSWIKGMATLKWTELKRLLYILDCKHDRAYLLKVVAGVDAGFDLSLLVEFEQLRHSPLQELLISDVPQVEATDSFVGLHQLHGVKRELVVPGLRHGQQVLPLACYTIGYAWNDEQWNRTD